MLQPTPRARIALLLRVLIDSPNRYTVRDLAARYGVSADTIEGDFAAFRAAGFEIKPDEKFRYAFIRDKPYQRLKDLLHFSEEDQALLYQAIDNLPNQTERHRRLKSKLGSLYDFGRLGHAYLRKPYLNKVDLLEQARQEKKQVVLENYHSSSSGTVEDRTVEPFHVSPENDMVQTYDVVKKKVNHFRISRFVRVRILDAPWQFEGHHNIRYTDPFRIVGNDNDPVMVHLRLGVGACNELTERFPLTKNYIEETAKKGVYDFQCRVNSQFLGLSNFILGFHHQGIEIIEPDALREHLRTVVANMNF